MFNSNSKIPHNFSELLKTFQPPSRLILGKHTAEFATAAVTSSSPQKILTTIAALRNVANTSLQGNSLAYPSSMTPELYNVETIGGMSAFILKAEHSQTAPTIILFYGGGFCLNTLEAHKAFMANVAAKYSCNVVIPDYPLAPENKAPEIIWRSTEFLRELLKHRASMNLSENIIMMGWSSGSSQALTTALNLQAESILLFNKISQFILLSPWVDLTLCVNREGPYQAQQNVDTLAAGSEMLEKMSKWYLPEDAKGDEPEFCPAYRSPDEISKLPPVTIISGGSEVLLGDGVFLAHELHRHGAPVQLIVLEGQTHNYLVFHQLSLDGVFVPELVANVISGEAVDDKVGKDGLGLVVRRFNMKKTGMVSV